MTVTKKKLTVAEAAETWERLKREQDAAKPQLEEAAAVLKEHFERTGRTSYKGRIGIVTVAGRLVLNQAKVREFLGAKLPDFQKRTEPSKSLTLLGD
jgi:hypothetical protein